jgi:DNA-binding response OmpR family regulator
MVVLVIDDDLAVRGMLRKMLMSEGFTVLEAANGIEGMRQLNENRDIEIVVTDLIMPDKEGIETIKEIRQTAPEIRIIAISGGGKWSAEDYLRIAERLGADATLCKPFLKKELLDTISGLKAKNE